MPHSRQRGTTVQRSLRRTLAVPGVLLALTATSLTPAAATEGNGHSIDPDAVSATIERADTHQIEAPIPLPPDSMVGHGVVIAGESVEAKTPPTSGGVVQVTSRHGRGSISIGLPTRSIGQAKPSISGLVTYADPENNTAVGVRVFDSGVQVSTVLESPESPHSFAYPIVLPPNAKIIPQPGGEVLFLGPDGNLLGGFAAPWAHDANGDDVPTHYEVVGDTVIQKIEARLSSTFPVVADPYLFIDLINSATWVHHTEGFTLEVTPTTWARSFAGQYMIGVYDWSELYSKYKDKGLNTNLNGMRDQLICHQVFVAVRYPGKSTWNLDEWRPDVGYVQTVNASCNPGGSKWFD